MIVEQARPIVEKQSAPLQVTGTGIRCAAEASALFNDLELRTGAAAKRQAPPPEALKLRVPNRGQLAWARIDLEELIPMNHKARAIWELTGKFDLTRFREGLWSVKGNVGRAAWDPRLLVSVWVYMLSEGVGSAREIARLMEYEPGLMWLSGGEVINHHTLSDFRAEHKEALDKLFTRLLALLEGDGLVTLELVAHDGTKVAAQAGSDSFRREKTVRERLERAGQLLEALEKAEPSEGNLRRRGAQLRAAREQQARLERALNELSEIQEEKGSEEEQREARVSLTDPEARIMKHGDQAFGPAFNLQISTDSAHGVMVGMGVTQCSADAPALPAAMEQVAQRTGQQPKQWLVDGGYTSEDNIVKAEAEKVDLIGSLADADKRTENALKSSGIAPEFGPKAFVEIEGANAVRCPAGQELPYIGNSQKKHRRYRQFRAAAVDCAACPFRMKCCPKSKGKGRTVSVLTAEHPSVAAFREKMERPESQQIYKRRGAIAEFPNAWIKDKIGLYKFRLRGLIKVTTEALWACLTYNVMIWVRLVWRPKLSAAVPQWK